MNIFQFLRILWAHRWLTLATTVVTLIGAYIAILLVPPSYEAHSRVMLNTLKPDPVTGTILPTTGSRTYVQTQVELIKDYGVAGEAVDQLAWTSNPTYIEQYQASGKSGGGDIRRWLSQTIMDRTDVRVLPGTNILEIAYRSPSAIEAKAMADSLRNAYLDSALQGRRAEATRTAAWYTQQAELELAALNAADAAKTLYEKENGIVMESDSTDIDTARLRSLAGQGVGAPAMIPSAAPTSASAIELAQLDQAISQASQNLGPNHPQMIAMKARRVIIAQAAARDEAASRSAMAAAAGAGAGALDQAVRLQTSKVIAKRDKIARLSQLQQDVALRRDQYTKSMERIAELRKEAAIADTGISSLGDAVMPQKAKFPNKPLIMGGALGMGFALGLALSVLLELFGRRVRGPEDLTEALDVPLLAIIGARGRDSSYSFAGGNLSYLRWLRRRPVQA